MSETWLTSVVMAIVIVIIIVIVVVIVIVMMNLEHTIERNEGRQIVLRNKTKSSGDHWLANATQLRSKIRGIGK